MPSRCSLHGSCSNSFHFFLLTSFYGFSVRAWLLLALMAVKFRSQEVSLLWRRRRLSKVKLSCFATYGYGIGLQFPRSNVVMHERRNEILISIVQWRGIGMAEQGSHSGESAPPPLWPRLDIPTRYHLWNQLLVGSRLNPRFCKGFSRII